MVPACSCVETRRLRSPSEVRTEAKRARAQELEHEAIRDAREFAHWVTTYGGPDLSVRERSGTGRWSGA